MTKETETETALVEVPENFKSQVAVFNDRKAFDALVEACRVKAADVGSDVSTAKARDEIKSMAFKIRKVGVAIDNAGSDLADDMRKQVGAIDKSRREYKATLVDLAETVRKPVTEWQEAEDARVKKVRETMLEITELGRVPFNATSALIANRIRDLDDMVIDESFGDLQEQAKDRATVAGDVLAVALVDAKERERQAAENERLRKEAAEQARIAAEERKARDMLEAQREAAERQKERDATARAAAQQAKIDALEAEATAAKERAAAAERREKEAAEREEKRLAAEEAENKRLELMAAAQQEAIAKAAKENEARIKQEKADETKLIGEAVIDLSNVKPGENGLVLSIVKAIIAGRIRHVTFGVV